MARAPWASDALNDTALHWVDACLRRDGSLFLPTAPIWAKSVVDEAALPLLVEDVSDNA